jgi:hypothetical protein
MDRTDVDQNRNQWRALMYTVMNLRGATKRGDNLE